MLSFKTKRKIIRTFNTVFYYLYPRRKIVIAGYFNRIGNRIGHTNLGDELNFYILEKLTGRMAFSRDDMYYKGVNLLFIGSIIAYYANRESVIYGAGLIDGDDTVKLHPKKVCAVRGKLTRKALVEQGIDCPEVFGDPALIMPLLYRPWVKKKYKYGIIPHVYDLNHPNIDLLQKMLGSDSCVISLKGYNSIEEVISNILQCENIISSSLHGIILADAYNIPNLWVEFSDRVEGDGFKFKDYFSSVKRSGAMPVDLRHSVDLETVWKGFDRFSRAEIDIVPLLEAAPFAIDPSLLLMAKEYYNR